MGSYTRVGECRHCGECCILLLRGMYQRCAHYDADAAFHCTIYESRPQICRDYPRAPIDVQWKPQCGYRFLDEHGRIVDGYMDVETEVRLRRHYLKATV